MENERFERQIRFFGQKGQDLLSKINVVVIGVGGTGSHICQQLAYLGIGSITIIDSDKIEKTNLNRLIGAYEKDIISTPKVDICERLILLINPKILISKIQDNFISTNGFNAIKGSGFVFNCVDNDGARLVLNELCLAYKIPFIDVASEINQDTSDFGGRIVAITNNQKCLYCLDQIDSEEARRYLENPDFIKDVENIYGISKNLLKDSGPAVVSINGIVASIAVTEFFLELTKIRKSRRLLIYNGKMGIVNYREEPSFNSCYYCHNIRGKREKANVERYIK